VRRGRRDRSRPSTGKAIRSEGSWKVCDQPITRPSSSIATAVEIEVPAACRGPLPRTWRRSASTARRESWCRQACIANYPPLVVDVRDRDSREPGDGWENDAIAIRATRPSREVASRRSHSRCRGTTSRSRRHGRSWRHRTRRSRRSPPRSPRTSEPRATAPPPAGPAPATRSSRSPAAANTPGHLLARAAVRVPVERIIAFMSVPPIEPGRQQPGSSGSWARGNARPPHGFTH
jgi:hypothetical protein